MIEGGVEVFVVSACHFIEINDIVFFTTFNAWMMQIGIYSTNKSNIAFYGILLKSDLFNKQ